MTVILYINSQRILYYLFFQFYALLDRIFPFVLCIFAKRQRTTRFCRKEYRFTWKFCRILQWPLNILLFYHLIVSPNWKSNFHKWITVQLCFLLEIKSMPTVLLTMTLKGFASWRKKQKLAVNKVHFWQMDWMTERLRVPE